MDLRVGRLKLKKVKKREREIPINKVGFNKIHKIKKIQDERSCHVYGTFNCNDFLQCRKKSYFTNHVRNCKLILDLLQVLQFRDNYNVSVSEVTEENRFCGLSCISHQSCNASVTQI